MKSGSESNKLFRGLVCDPAGNLISAAPPSRPAHKFDYNAVNLEAACDPPDLGLPNDVTRREYNRAQQLTGIVRPDGQRVELAYDSGGRLDHLTTPRGTRNLSYDPRTGHLVALSAEDGTGLMFDYHADLLTAEHLLGEVDGSVGFGYDTERRIQTLSVNDGDTVFYGYDPDGLLTQAGALTLTRDPASGLLIGTSLGQVTTTRGYNAFAELARQTAQYQDNPLYQASYTRDTLGRITEKTETVDGEPHMYDYGYDLAGRLEHVTKDGVTVSTYTYDANGNRLSGPRGTYAYDAQDRLTSFTALAGGVTSYAYTANGELQSKTANGATTTYDYDVLGNLRTVTLPGNLKIDYVIDGRNRRVGKKVNGQLVQGFLYQDQLNPVAELDGSGNVVSRFVYGSKPNAPEYLVKGGVTYRILSDSLGSVRLVVNSQTGEIVQRVDYDEFGNVTLDTNPGFQPFGFAGGLYDRDTGLVRFGARDYDPQTGRWTAKDPILFAGGDPNLYAYLVGDPVNLTDPPGLQSIQTDPFFNGGIDQQTAIALTAFPASRAARLGINPLNGAATCETDALCRNLGRALFDLNTLALTSLAGEVAPEVASAFCEINPAFSSRFPDTTDFIVNFIDGFQAGKEGKIFQPTSRSFAATLGAGSGNAVGAFDKFVGIERTFKAVAGLFK